MTLRWFDEHDASFVLELLNDAAWIANIGNRNVHTLDEARQYISEKLVAGYRRDGHGLWAMVRRSDDALLGMCGLLKRDTLPEIDIGYALAPAFRGFGYAREAVLGCLSYAQSVLGKRRVLAIVSPANGASIRVLESVGMVADTAHVLDAAHSDTVLYTWDLRAKT